MSNIAQNLKKKFQKNLTHFPLNGVRKKTLYEAWIFQSRHLPVTHQARVRDCTLRIITGVVTPINYQTSVSPTGPTETSPE